MVVVHRIWWWRLCSTTYLWKRRWLRSPSPEAQSLEQWGHWMSVVVITAEAALRCLSLSLSLSGSSEFLASSLFKVGSSSVNRALAFWSVHGISLQVSDWCGTSEDWLWPCLYTAVLVYLDFFCRPEVPRRSGVSASDTHPFESRAQPIVVGPWWWWPLCWWT